MSELAIPATVTASSPTLPCHGCAHSAARYEFPSFPSGERPCCFCVRNPEREAWLAKHLEDGCDGDECRHPVHGVWYDGSRAKGDVPLDNYITLDRLNQGHGR